MIVPSFEVTVRMENLLHIILCERRITFARYHYHLDLFSERRSQDWKNSTMTGTRATGDTAWSWPSRMRRLALGISSTSACAPSWKNGSLLPPTITRVGPVKEAQRLGGSGFPVRKSFTIMPS